MLSSDIQPGRRYVVTEWSKPVARIVNYNFRPRLMSLGFPGYWRYWVVNVVGKSRQGWLVEWDETIALHRIPETPMRWGMRTVTRLIKPAQIVREV